ncbi:MAG: HD-GYP domain-containing protein, partial [bacterium]
VLCEELDVKRSRREKIVNMAKIHDIGKINVDDEILKKPDRLTEKEFKEMKKHSKYGYEILKEIDLFEDSLKVIFHHHEQYDGSGYPEGISGEEIPLGARILNVCDAFDVMTTGRTYKQALDKPAVIEELKQYSGRQFDPQIAEKMINLIKKGRFDGAFRSTIREKQTQLRAKLKTE